MPPSGAGEPDGPTEDVEPLLRELHDHLAATGELPVETEASRWLGEAEAVAADVVDGEAPPAAVETRIRQVRDLLSNVDETGSAAADEHVAAALSLSEELAGER